MQFIKSFLLSLVLTVGCFAAPVFVQQSARGNVSSIVSTLFDLNLLAGNTVVCVAAFASTQTSTSGMVTDGVSTPAMTRAATATVTGVTSEIWYIYMASPLAAARGQVTLSGSSRFYINCSQWSGLANSAPFAVNTNTAVTSTTVTTNSVTPSVADNLVIAGGGWTANNYSSGPINSFTRLTQGGSVLIFGESAYLIQTSAALNSTGWTLTAPINWAATIAVFNATTGPTNAQRSAGFWMPPNE